MIKIIFFNKFFIERIIDYALVIPYKLLFNLEKNDWILVKKCFKMKMQNKGNCEETWNP